MPVGGGQVTAQRGHALHGARLGAHVALGGGARHAPAQGAVDTRYGQAGHEPLAYGLVPVGVVEQGDQQLRRDIVVERKAAAIGYQVVAGVQPQAGDEAVHHRGSLQARCLAVPAHGGQAVEEALGIYVVTALEHRPHHLVDGMLQRKGHQDFSLEPLHLGDILAPQPDTRTRERLGPERGHALGPAHQVGGQGAVVVIPAPSPAVGGHLVGRHQLAHPACHAVNARLAQGAGQGVEVGPGEQGIHVAPQVQVALEHAAGEPACGDDLGGEWPEASLAVKQGDAGDQLLARGRAHAVQRVVGIDGAPVGEVVDVQPQLGGLADGRAAQGVQALLHPSQPRLPVGTLHHKPPLPVPDFLAIVPGRVRLGERRGRHRRDRTPGGILDARVPDGMPPGPARGEAQEQQGDRCHVNLSRVWYHPLSPPPVRSHKVKEKKDNVSRCERISVFLR